MSATTPWRRPLGRLMLGACAAAALAAPALAAQQPPGPPQGPAAPAPPEIEATPQRSFANDIVGLMDITYARNNGFRPQKLDIYTSRTKAAAPKPLVIWLHGGGWAVGDQRGGGIGTPAYRDWPATLAALAARGYVVASVAYRFANEVKYPEPIKDVKAAVRWLKTNAATYGADPNRVVIWGGSAGAHIAEIIGTTCNVAELEAPAMRGADASSCVNGVIDFYGPSDFSKVKEQLVPGAPPSRFGDLLPGASGYLGCDVATNCPADKLRMSNPITFIDKSDPPFLIVHGDADGTVPLAQSRMLQDALVKGGVKSELVVVPKADHVFAGGTDTQGKEIMDKVYAFLDATTGVKPAN